MAGISFSGKAEGVWIVAGWAFRQLLADVRTKSLIDRALSDEIEEAENLGFLHVDMMPPDLATRMTTLIRSVAKGVTEGALQSGIVDSFKEEATKEQYFESLRSLLDKVPDENRVSYKEMRPITYGFHEATIVGISKLDGTIRLILEGAHVSDKIVSRISVSFVNIERILRENVPVQEIVMEYKDGEILTLDHSEDAAHLIVLWTDFSRQLERTVSYRISCRQVKIEPL